MSCTRFTARREAASAKKSLFKEIQRSRHTDAHTPDANLSNVQKKKKKREEKKKGGGEGRFAC